MKESREIAILKNHTEKIILSSILKSKNVYIEYTENEWLLVPQIILQNVR